MRDIGTVVLFAFVSGVLTLAIPLAVESLVNVVSWGTYIQPLIVLGVILLLKLAYEQFVGPVPGSAETTGGTVIVAAHLYGAIAAGVAAAVMHVRVVARAPI